MLKDSYQYTISDSGRVDRDIPTVHDYLLPIRVTSCRRYEVHHCTRNFRPAVPDVSMATVAVQWMTYLPGRSAGTDTIACPSALTSFAPASFGRRFAVISDTYTPGAIPHTRTGTFLRANSVAIIFVR